MSSFDVLNQETEIFGAHFLEASAGTGKTFAIENIVPRLLLDSEKDLKLEEILVVTFTRAATRELVKRIYQNLSRVKQALEQGRNDPAYLASFQGEEKKRRASRRMEEALYSFDQAQVFTLHGFCSKMLHEFAFETHFIPSEQEEQREVLKGYIKEFLRHGIDPEVISPMQLRKAIRYQGSELASLCEALLHRLERGQDFYPYPGARESWMLWNQALSSLPKTSLESLWHDFSLLAPRLSKVKKRADQARLLFNWMEKGGCSFEEWDALLGEKELFLEAISFETAYQKKGMDALVHPGLFERLKETLVPLHEKAKDPRMAFLLLARACLPHYEKGREMLSYCSPDDLVFRLRAALQKDKKLQEKVQQKYRAVIVDEFQDTDSAQWSIFEELFLRGPSKLLALYLVGDPKQSIYAFRQADVYLYLRASSLLGKEALAHLDTNFRSHPDLVEALNVLFSFDLPSNWMQLPLTGGHLEVRKVKSKPLYPSPLDKEEKGRVHFLFFQDEGGRGKRWPREQVEEEVLFPSIAEEIIRLKQEHGYSFSQIAVLVKDRYQALRLQKVFFKRYNIPCSMQQSGDLINSLAYEAIYGFLLALTRPRSASALKRFLGGPLLAFSAQDVQREALLLQIKEYFIEASSLFKQKGFGVLFQDFLLSSPLDRKKEGSILEELLSREDPSLYFELRHLVQGLLECCVEGRYDASKLLQFLEQMKASPAEEEAFLKKQCFEQEEDQVQVMTLHKSKGLEFEIVFALGLCSRYAKKEDFIFLREKEDKQIVIAFEGDQASFSHQKELDAEKLRQLYVAFTRAKERLYVPMGFALDPGQEVLPGSASPMELFWGAIGLVDYSFEAVYQALSSLSLEKALLHLEKIQGKDRVKISYERISPSRKTTPYIPSPPLLVMPPLLCLPKKAFSSFLSFSSLIHDQQEVFHSTVGKTSFQEEKSSSWNALPLGSETGTVIHAILEEVCKADLHRAGGGIEKVIYRRCHGSCLQGSEDIVLQMVKAAVQVSIPLPGVQEFSLQCVPAKDMQLEMEFLYPVQESLLKGFIDLVFRFQGKYYLLDWKTNFLGKQEEGYTQEKLEQCMEEHGYFLQASIYAMALKKYLALFEERAFERQLFGGAIYFFLRGMKPYVFLPHAKEEVLCLRG